MKINDIDWSKVPGILAKEQVRLLCHCSKRTALYYLKSGKLPCIYSGKKTRCYKIRKEDLMAFIEDRENHPEFYAVSEGWYKESGRTVLQHYPSEIKIDGKDLHEYYRFLLKEYPDVLEVKKVREITGYAIPVINRWCNKGKVKYFSIRAMNMIPTIWQTCAASGHLLQRRRNSPRTNPGGNGRSLLQQHLTERSKDKTA